LDRTRIVPIIGKFIATGMAEHVGVRRDAQFGLCFVPSGQLEFKPTAHCESKENPGQRFGG
jgi:hypothetical protein